MVNFEPYWPDVVFFWGAGATKSLGMSTTQDIGDKVFILSRVDNDDEISLQMAVNEAFADTKPHICREIEALLIILGDSGEQDEALQLLQITKARADELQQLYDWSGLKEVIKRCPRSADSSFDLVDCYNLIDLHADEGNGFISVNGELVQPERIGTIRNALNLIVKIIHATDYRILLSNKQNVLEKYYGFSLELGKLMREEGMCRFENGALMQERLFYLFSYAIISINWDPFALWLTFYAHKVLNDSADIPHIGSPPLPLKLFNDMAHFMAVREIDGNTPRAWFPMNETVVQRLNDPEHITGRRVRIGKIYFPHGSHGFRQCPNCRKLTMYLGDEWDIASHSLFAPEVIPSLSYNNPRSPLEKKAFEAGKYDAVQCSHCGQITQSHHTQTVMQTNFKGGYPSFLEEIQDDMRIAIEKAKHIVFFGYSLPKDDFIYRSILASRRKLVNPPKCSIVNYGAGLPDEWIDSSYLDEKKHSDLLRIYRDLTSLFGEGSTRIYGAGIPNVFMDNGVVSRRKIKCLLEWQSP